MPARPVAVSGSAGTLELRAVEAGRSQRSALLATLVRPVALEPRDACFGLYAASQDPVEGDVVCGVRRPDRLVSSLGETVIPGLPGTATYVLGQAPADLTQVQLIGPAASHPLPLSEHRVFLAVLSPSARGAVELRAVFADGQSLTSTFTLPLTANQIAGALRYRRPGAVFNDEVGENILTQSYRRVVSRFGALWPRSAAPTAHAACTTTSSATPTAGRSASGTTRWSPRKATSPRQPAPRKPLQADRRFSRPCQAVHGSPSPGYGG